jgi:hypothetical protein
MTESGWLACSYPERMLEYLEGKASERKLRLFAVACCRRIWPMLWDPGRLAVEVSERYADGLASKRELAVARAATAAGDLSAQVATERALDWDRAAHLAWCAAREAIRPVAARVAVGGAWASGCWWPEYLAQTALLREIFGNPFRPIAPGPACLAWNGGAIPQMARAIYEEGRWQDLPFLADALEEAGCADPEILNHCRRPGVHVKGCWVIDLCLGKE